LAPFEGLVLERPKGQGRTHITTEE
jgi:hypothetical protein